LTISVAVMAHPSRRRFVDELTEALDRPAEVVWDRHNDRWDTGRRSLLAHDPDATHHLVVQDDAIVCRDLVAGLERAVEFSGDRPVGLYVGKVKPHPEKVAREFRRARDAGSTWLQMEGPTWGVGLVLPTGHIDEIVAYGDRERAIDNYDSKIKWFYHHQAIPCWYTVPSLVDHRPVAENPSLIDGRTGNRRAHLFLGTRVSALGIDWSDQPHLPGGPEPDHVAFRSRFTGKVIEVHNNAPIRSHYEARPSIWEPI
jgi:hypothetical protein